MAKEWKLQNAVKKFKPEKIDALKRNNGNLSTAEFKSLIKEIECYYEEVWYDGRGRKRIIYTDKKRKEKIEKKDKRHLNKGVAPSHSKYLALMVMSKLNEVDSFARTRNAWANYFGVISNAELDILRGIYSEVALNPFKDKLIELKIIEDGEEKTLQDLALILKNVVRGHFQTVLDQAERLNLIRIKSSWKGKVTKSRFPRFIDATIAEQVNSVEQELLNKYGITKSYALMYKNSQKTKDFMEEFHKCIETFEDEEGKPMGLQYIYEVFQIETIKENVLCKYIESHYPQEANLLSESNYEQQYNEKLLDYVVENARRNYHKFIGLEESTNAIDVQEFEEMFGAILVSTLTQQQELEMFMESTPYEALKKSSKYVDCIKSIHDTLHKMSSTETESIRAIYRDKERRKKEKLEKLEKTRLVNHDNGKTNSSIL